MTSVPINKNVVLVLKQKVAKMIIVMLTGSRTASFSKAQKCTTKASITLLGKAYFLLTITRTNREVDPL